MNMQAVNPLPAFCCNCFECGKALQSDREPIFADLDGEPFKAYYCQACATGKTTDTLRHPAAAIPVLAENILFALAVTRGDRFRQWFYPEMPESYSMNPAVADIAQELMSRGHSAQQIADLVYAVFEGVPLPLINGRVVLATTERYIRERIKASAGLPPGWE